MQQISFGGETGNGTARRRTAQRTNDNAVPCEDEIEYVNDTLYKSLLKWFVRYRSLARCARVFFSTFSDVYKKFHRIILRLLLR